MTTYYTLTIFDAELVDNIVQQVDQRIPKYSYVNPNGNIDSPVYGTMCTLIHPASTNVLVSMSTGTSGNVTQWTPMVGVGATGAIYSLNAGSNMTITQSGSTITFNSSSGSIIGGGTAIKCVRPHAWVETVYEVGNISVTNTAYTEDGLNQNATGPSLQTVNGVGYYLRTGSMTGTSGNAYRVRSSNAFTDASMQPFFSINGALTSTSNIRLWIGIQAAGTAYTSDTLSVNAGMFRYSTGAGDTTLKAITCNGTTSTIIDTGIVPDTKIHWYAVYMPDANHVQFYYDGNLVATGTATLPTGALFWNTCITTLSTSTPAFIWNRADQETN